MSSPNQLLALMPTRALREILLRAIGGIVGNDVPDEALADAIRTQLATIGMVSFQTMRSGTRYVCTLLTPTALLRLEVATNGSYAVFVVPTSRVRQVSEQRALTDDNRVVHEIVIEFDAGVVENQQAGNGLTVSKPGGWVLTPERTPDGLVPPASTDQMILFGAQLRHLALTQHL